MSKKVDSIFYFVKIAVFLNMITKSLGLVEKLHFFVLFQRIIILNCTFKINYYHMSEKSMKIYNLKGAERKFRNFKSLNCFAKFVILNVELALNV